MHYVQINDMAIDIIETCSCHINILEQNINRLEFIYIYIPPRKQSLGGI